MNLHQDMVGALQTAGSRVQHIIRSPHHNASYLADVVQSIAEVVIQGNSGYLAAGQAGGRYPFSRPIFFRLGTRDGYRAEIVPNFNNSDHMVFNDGIIGIPAVGFINWPDDYLANRPRVSTGLTSLMTYSVWGHVDGETSYLDIYKQVMGEATAAGAWYYGTVTLEQVVRTLEAGVLVLR